MLNVRLLLAGCALTLLSAYVVVNMHEDAEACTAYINIEWPEDGAIFYSGEEFTVESSFSFPGDPMDPIDIYGELQCTATARVESADVDHTVLANVTSYHHLVGPTEADSDFADDFCIVVSACGESDRVGATFLPWSCYCMCMLNGLLLSPVSHRARSELLLDAAG